MWRSCDLPARSLQREYRHVWSLWGPQSWNPPSLSCWSSQVRGSWWTSLAPPSSEPPPPPGVIWMSCDCGTIVRLVTWLSCDCCDCHVIVMWLLCHVSVMWLSCDCHAIVMWLSCDLFQHKLCCYSFWLCLWKQDLYICHTLMYSMMPSQAFTILRTSAWSNTSSRPDTPSRIPGRRRERRGEEREVCNRYM